MKTKQCIIEVVERKEAGGLITISTSKTDRGGDRVFPLGCDASHYMQNPIVQWGHDTRSPWATIGRTVDLIIDKDGVSAEFELREPAGETDPQHIVRMLWKEGFINTASVGFIPDWKQAEMNDEGGMDFFAWELLEWSLVPIPANPDARRRIHKHFPLFATDIHSLFIEKPEDDTCKDNYDDRLATLEKQIQALYLLRDIDTRMATILRSFSRNNNKEKT